MQDQAAYTIERSVGDAVGVIKALGHDRAMLVVHDWGGFIGWWAIKSLPFLQKAMRWASLKRWALTPPPWDIHLRLRWLVGDSDLTEFALHPLNITTLCQCAIVRRARHAGGARLGRLYWLVGAQALPSSGAWPLHGLLGVAATRGSELPQTLLEVL